MKRIGILTRDCAGINACIRAIVRTASASGVESVGILRGYQGLMDGDIQLLDRRAVSGIINLGGTILKTARAYNFKTRQGQLQGIKTIEENKLDGLIVIGGNGSLTGAHVLAAKYNIKTIGIPATIDNDINGVEMSIGADTAINVAMDALDKIRDTATSLERIFVVEVMGRDCGYIALRVALAGGCEEVLLPEKSYNMKKICSAITKGNTKGKVSWIIIVAEGKAKAADIAEKITTATNFETKTVVLGHIQRGGSPSAFDRLIAARYANYAFNLLKANKSDCCVTLKNEQLSTIPLAVAIKHKDIGVDEYYKLIKILT